jgi:glyoxylase-like metal-dependent hydrolase (beta-lactamase superfamily II)
MLAIAAAARYRSRMKLEDHLGDIIGKARAMSGVSIAAAAAAAGISETELSALEATGQIGRRPDLAALANLIGLDPDRLAGIAGGWHPGEKDLSLWRELRAISTTEGGNTVHCYLIWDEVTRDAALFDTGWEAAPVFKLIEENQLQLKHLFITHTHADHVAGLQAIRERFPKIHLHTDARGAPPQHRNRRNDFIMLGSLRVTNRETPGHAEDGVTYIIGNWPDDAPHVAIVGDAIFAGSLGRGNQSWDLARQKVREQILSLPPETLICPGHGPLTTVAEEKAHNPFFHSC